MTRHEIFTILANRMVGAIMIHTQLAQLFAYIDLMPDARRHEQQLQEETHGLSELNKYYSQHHHAIIISDNPPQIDILSMGILKKPNYDLSPDDKIRIIQYGNKEWVDWERQSKIIYEDAYKNLIDISEVASAEFITRYVRDVDQELRDAERLYRVRDTIDWDLPTLYDKQARLKK